MKLSFSKDIYDSKLVSCPTGSKTRKVHFLSLDDKGQECLDYKEEDLQEIIQSYADSCSIERIIIAHGLGDTMVMNKRPGVYLDEENVNAMSDVFSLDNLNSKLITLYKKSDTELSFEDFTKAILSGDFQLLNKKSVQEGGSEDA